MYIYFSTVIRSAPVFEGGALYYLDWRQKKILKKVDLMPTNPVLWEPNPRGNTRGGRGVFLLNSNMVAVCTYHTIKVFDRSLNHLYDYSDDLMVGLHDGTLSAHKGRVWVTATAIDAALEYDMDAKQLNRMYWPREMPGIQKKFDLIPLKIDKRVDNRSMFLETHKYRTHSHLHLNAVAEYKGELYALLNAFGAIVNLTTEKIVIEDKRLIKGHNLIIREDGLVIANDSFGSEIQFYNIKTGQLINSVELRKNRDIRALAKRSDVFFNRLGGVIGVLRLRRWLHFPRPYFFRGLAMLNDFLFVGVSPGTIICLDIKSNELVDYFQLPRCACCCARAAGERKLGGQNIHPLPRSRTGAGWRGEQPAFDPDRAKCG